MSLDTPSLRNRYILLTIVIAVSAAVVVWLFYRDLTHTQEEVIARLEQSRAWARQLDEIRNDYTRLYQDIDLFLLDPLRGRRPREIQASVDLAVGKIAAFHATLEQARSDMQYPVQHLHDDLLVLRGLSDDLFKSRMDVRRQYPGMAISAFDMVPFQQNVSNGFGILINEIESGSLKPASPQIYPTLLKAHGIWSNVVSQMRIYLANRFASFSNSILVEQSRSLDDLYAQLLEKIEIIKQAYAREDSFEGAEVIRGIQSDAARWHALFQSVRRVSESEKWRGDTLLMKTEIIPLINDITEDFLDAEGELQSYEKQVAQRLQESKRTLTLFLATMVGLFLAFIMAILVSLDWLVFRPLGVVVEALKARTFDKVAPQALRASTREIGQLIEAYQEMDRQVSQRQHDLEHQALHDALTSLPNRFLLNQRLEYQFLSADRNAKGFVLVLMDLNNFKDINDALGHLAGDALLIEVARRLAGQVRKSDTLARLGGDEFALLLQGVSLEEAQPLAQAMHDALTAPFSINGHAINIGISIGIAGYPDDAGDATTLMQHADIAMYYSKRNRQPFAYYNASQDFFSQNRLTLSNDLRQAIEHDHLELHFQPQVDIASGRLAGAEALLRWKHPEHGHIRPDKVVELAEYMGSIYTLSAWVLDRALRECAAWHAQGHRLSVSVNLSVHDLTNTGLGEQIDRMLERHGLPGECLILEITESGMMDNPGRSIEMLRSLSARGIKLSIDDFGTGFSSLAYLKLLPVDELKIDKSFVLDMENNPSDAMIVQSTIALGHNLGLKVVAEGVETPASMELIKVYGCDLTQGYYISKPLPAKAFAEFARDWRAPSPAP
ncbi:MAG: EAL domain-containing protein [Pseudomonadota bacterium]